MTAMAANNSADLQLRIDNIVDLAVLVASGGSGLEDQDIEGQVTLRSGGRESAANATLDIEVHAAGALRGARIHHGDDCELLTPQRARCALPVLARDAQLYVDYTAQFAEPGTYDVKFTLNTPGDTAAANDTLARALLVRPYNDISVTGDLDLTRILAGGTREATFMVSAGRRALATARFIGETLSTGHHGDLGSRRAGRVPRRCDCRRQLRFRGSGRPAAQVAVTVAWRAEHACDQDVAVGVSTAGDVVAVNNEVRGRAEVMAPDGPGAARGQQRRRLERCDARLPADLGGQWRREGLRRAPRSDAARRGLAGQCVRRQCHLQRHHGAAL